MRNLVENSEGLQSSEVDRGYFTAKAGILEGSARQSMVHDMMLFELAKNFHKRDILYFVNKALFLYSRAAFAEVGEYFGRVSEIRESLNPSLDTVSYFKNFQVKSYDNYIDGSVEECLCIAFSLCGSWPKNYSYSSDNVELLESLIGSIGKDRETEKVLSGLCYNLGISEKSLQDVFEIRYSLFCR